MSYLCQKQDIGLDRVAALDEEHRLCKSWEQSVGQWHYMDSFEEKSWLTERRLTTMTCYLLSSGGAWYSDPGNASKGYTSVAYKGGWKIKTD